MNEAFSEVCIISMSNYDYISLKYIFTNTKCGEGSVVGADPTLIGSKQWMNWKESLEINGIDLRDETTNIIDHVWTEANGRPRFQVYSNDDIYLS